MACGEDGSYLLRNRSAMRVSIIRALLAVTLLVSGRAAGAASDTPLAVGAPAPPVDEPTTAGRFDSTTSGKPYVLEFFAVWCPHCQREAAVVNELQTADGNRVDVIAVPASPFSFDRTTILQQSDLDAFAARYHVRYRIGFDGLYALSNEYGVDAFPTFYFVTRNRTIAAVESGEIPFERLHADVDALFAPPR